MTNRRGTRLVAEYAATQGSRALDVAGLLGLDPLLGPLGQMAEIAARCDGIHIVAWLTHNEDTLVVSRDWLRAWRHLVRGIWVEASEFIQDIDETDVINLVLRNGHEVVASRRIVGNDASQRQSELAQWIGDLGGHGRSSAATHLDIELIARWGIAGLVLDDDVLDLLKEMKVDLHVFARGSSGHDHGAQPPGGQHGRGADRRIQ
ncbi:hypothetical protein FQ142_02890 [Microbacterium sp. ANT_H45B]|uniref:hypothetical protein n=1 Tax=Microbacterium sp. ANT_H45B TaxID=2597346 RepID=UPI0011ECBDDA|nr:hypothetical protein [Microbacterium sp. ANT_H45B]KAA0962291.1 hypothetical protein FQ142_02890 [Microbacterium sp. ANT_H45B]